MSDPMGNVRKLTQRLQQEAEAIGLHMEQVALIPNLNEDGPTLLQAVFTLRPEAVEEPKSSEQLEIDKMFEDMMLGEKQVEQETKIDTIRDDVAKWLDEK